MIHASRSNYMDLRFFTILYSIFASTKFSVFDASDAKNVKFSTLLKVSVRYDTDCEDYNLYELSKSKTPIVPAHKTKKPTEKLTEKIRHKFAELIVNMTESMKRKHITIHQLTLFLSQIVAMDATAEDSSRLFSPEII